MPQVAIDATTLQDYQVLARLIVSTTTGAIQLWQQDQLQWSREEGLSEIKVAEFVELPERKIVASGMSEETETFFERLRRQITEARDFPQYLAHFVNRFVTGSYESASGPVAPLLSSNETNALSRDAFGFRKVVVAATSRGKVYGIDSSSGAIIWSRVLGLGWAAEVGGRIFPVKIFTTKTIADGDSPQVVLVTQRKANNVSRLKCGRTRT
jgi:ER membrane protein complex subunit 1